MIPHILTMIPRLREITEMMPRDGRKNMAWGYKKRRN